MRQGGRRDRRRSASRHHCSRISPSVGSLTVSRTRATSTSKACRQTGAAGPPPARTGRRDSGRDRGPHDGGAMGGRHPWPSDMGSDSASVHRDQGGGDGAILGEQDVVGADRRAGRHRLADDAGLATALAGASARAARAPGRCRRAGFRSASASANTRPGSPRRSPPARAPSHRCRSAGRAASRDATCRRSGTRHCHRRRSARGRESARRGRRCRPAPSDVRPRRGSAVFASPRRAAVSGRSLK